MRAFIILLTIVVLAGVGWFLFIAEPAGPGTGEEAATAADEAPESTQEAADEAAEAVGSAAEEVGTAVEEAAEATRDAAGAMSDTAEEAGAAVADALTAEGFDPVRLREAIAGSDLSEEQKQSAEALVQSAERNSELVPSVIDELRSMLGL
ncbi:MAG: hypothetical protein RIE24_10580 [Silicimonas sp.]